MEDKKDLQSIENIEIVFLKMEDYEDIKKAMQEAYRHIPMRIGIKTRSSHSLENFQKVRWEL